MSDVLPQHDLDERKRLGREIGLANARRGQGSAQITDKGREALAFQKGWDAARDALQPYLDNAINSLVRGEQVLRGTV